MADENSSLLLELPAELRIRIYAYAVSLPRNSSGRSKLAIPSLAQVNRQIRSEVIPILYGTTTIALDCATPPKRSMPFRFGGLMSLLNRVRLTSEYSAVWFLSLQSRCQMSAIGIQEEKFEDALGEFTRSAVVWKPSSRLTAEDQIIGRELVHRKAKKDITEAQIRRKQLFKLRRKK